MSGIVEDLAHQIPQELMTVSGRVFYSGRRAFANTGAVYLLGWNPGGDPDLQSGETISQCVEFARNEAPDLWSAYCDESWTGRPTGKARLQLGVQHLLSKIGLSPRETPASNLIFARSRQRSHIDDNTERTLIGKCWPFHVTVIQRLRPRAIICLGVATGQAVRKRLGAAQEIAKYVERNRRCWSSYAWQASTGLLVFGLTHPGRANWLNPSADPSEMVASVLCEQACEAS